MDHRGRGPVTLAELAAGLIWPRLFRALPMALAPNRLALSFCLVAVMLLVGAAYDLISEPITLPSRLGVAAGPVGLFESIILSASVFSASFTDAVLQLEPTRSLHALFNWLDFHRELFAAHWLGASVLLAIWLLLLAVFGGALCRINARDAADETYLSSAQAMRFALPRARQLVLSILGPAAFILALTLAIPLAGYLFMGLAGLNVVGALAYVVPLLATLVVVLLTIALALGNPVLLPAVATESCDWLDAIQRAYSYVFGKTLRYLLYLTTLVILGALSLTIAAWITSTVLNLTASLVFAWSNSPAADMAGGYAPFSFQTPPVNTEVTGSAHTAGVIIRFWERVALAALLAFFLSYYFSASTVLYLLARRINDGQDIDEIWTPDLIQGTMAPIDATDEPDA